MPSAHAVRAIGPIAAGDTCLTPGAGEPVGSLFALQLVVHRIDCADRAAGAEHQRHDAGHHPVSHMTKGTVPPSRRPRFGQVSYSCSQDCPVTDQAQCESLSG